MSTAATQISQYKDAIKILKKKCSSAESQYNGTVICNQFDWIEIKVKYEELETILVNFLQFITSPFSGIFHDVENKLYREQSSTRFDNGRFALLVGD